MWEAFKQLKDKIYFVKHIVYKNKSRNHKDKINSYEASYKEIEGKELIFNYNDWINDPDTKVSILIKTKESYSSLKEKTQALNKLTPSEYFDSDFTENIPTKYLSKLKESEIRINDQICNHSIIKLYNTEFVGYFTITNGKIMKALIYETNEKEQSKIYEMIVDKSITGSDLDIFGLGQVYSNQKNGNIIKDIYLESSVLIEFQIDPQEDIVLDEFQKIRFDNFKIKLGNTIPTNLSTEVREELSSHKWFIYKGRLYPTDKDIVQMPYDVDLKSNVNNENLIDILKDKLD